ncbi:hypothetical protein niasHT_032213 [Heterodera trifolii]|uniref:Uncharacterized protein n=1 Tax=Heterodera trifolii TaxID=157864 RepID=A0ABD2HVH1_9BILA
MCWRGNSTNSFGHLMTYTAQYCGLLHDTCAKQECILKVDGKVISTNTVRKCEVKALCQMFDFNVGVFECKTYCCSNENFCNGVEAVVLIPHFTGIVFFALTMAILVERAQQFF